MISVKDKIFDAEFFKKLENISINARMPMTEGASGGRKSKAKGSSVEFSDFREYALGDDFRRIDWNAYGRFDKLFVKLFMEEREALVNIFIDCSKSMDYGEQHKGTCALKLAAVLGYLALNNLDRVCINRVAGDNLAPSISYMGRGMFSRTIDFLQQTEFSGTTNLSSAIKKKDLKQRGISILISDFFTKGSLEEAIKYLVYKRQEVILIHILSKEEIEPELNGQVRLIDVETSEDVTISVTPKLLKLYRDKFNSFTSNLKEQTKRFNGSFLQICSEEPLEKIIFEHFTKEGII